VSKDQVKKIFFFYTNDTNGLKIFFQDFSTLENNQNFSILFQTA